MSNFSSKRLDAWIQAKKQTGGEFVLDARHSMF